MIEKIMTVVLLLVLGTSIQRIKAAFPDRMITANRVDENTDRKMSISTPQVFDLDDTSLQSLLQHGDEDPDAAFRLYQYYNLIVRDFEEVRKWFMVSVSLGNGIAQKTYMRIRKWPGVDVFFSADEG